MNSLKPAIHEYASFYAGYVAQAQGLTDPVASLEKQRAETLAFLQPLTPDQQTHRYAPGKWSIKEVVNHLTDSERIFSYRALCIGRNDTTPLPSFDEMPYVASAEADRLAWHALLSEFDAVRQATVQLLRNLPDAAWPRMGTASNQPISVRALAFIMYGHVVHHTSLIRERYL